MHANIMCWENSLYPTFFFFSWASLVSVQLGQGINNIDKQSTLVNITCGRNEHHWQTIYSCEYNMWKEWTILTNNLLFSECRIWMWYSIQQLKKSMLNAVVSLYIMIKIRPWMTDGQDIDINTMLGLWVIIMYQADCRYCKINSL